MEIVVGRVNCLNSRESSRRKPMYLEGVKKKTSGKFTEIAGKMIL